MGPRAGRYGFDGDYEHVPAWAQAVIGGTFIAALATASANGIARRRPVQAVAAGLPAFALGGIAALFLQATLVGKFVVWERLLDELRLCGDERVLDLGCGRGAVLLAAARRLVPPRGRAVGVDLWRADQTGNDAARTRENAELEGVADGVDICTADMTRLPFPDASFDVIVSNLAIHNLPDRAARGRALAEAVRVLRPGGRLRLVDLAFTRQHADQLRELGLRDVTRRNVGWRLWFGAPFLPAHVVAATRS